MVKKRAKVSDIDLFASTTSERFDSKPAKSEEPPKVKNTYYLTTDTDQRLEYARVTLRRITGKKISKSDIIDAALQSAIGELETRESESHLAIMLSK